MKLKKEQIKKKASNIKEDSDKKNKILRISNAHKEKMLSISNKFRESMNKIEMENSDVKKQEDMIKEKQKEKKESRCPSPGLLRRLKIEKDKIENEYSNDIDIFKSEKEKKLIEKYEIKKKEIDLKYAYLENIFEPNFEYSEEEKNEKNYYLQNINAIRKFSNIK